MSELQFYLSSPRPAIEPIETRGNNFWREDRRFFIKGIYYSPKQSDADVPAHSRPRIDFLADEHLDDLRRDIPIIQELGLNTISVSHLEPSKSHGQALRMLCDAGLYVLVNILDGLRAPPVANRSGPSNTVNSFDTQQAYLINAILSTFELIDQLSDHVNVLAYVVSAESLAGDSKMAELVRACVRDVKHFLRVRPHGRRIPVGVSNAELLMQRRPALRYFTAGHAGEDARADFFAPQSWGWVGKSSFKISGWKNLVEMLEQCPVPMFLHEFGANAGQPRPWEEVKCLFSRDVTATLSGGIAYQYFEDGTKYGIVEVVQTGLSRERRWDFEALKEQMRVVNRRKLTEICDGEVKDYDNWIGEFPTVVKGVWHATANPPVFPGDWKEVQQKHRLLEAVRTIRT